MTSPQMPQSLSSDGLDLLKEYEQFRETAYIAEKNGDKYTIGYGFYNMPGITAESTMTLEEAEVILVDKLKEYEGYVRTNVNVDLTQNQFDALVLFSYNTGASKSDSVWEEINNGNFYQAMIEMAGWRRANGSIERGLIARRNDEIELFMSGDKTRGYSYTDHHENKSEIGGFSQSAVTKGLNNGTLSMGE